MPITRWILNYNGIPYTFERNPDRSGGDTGWSYQQRNSEIDIIGASLPTLQIDGFKGAIRQLRFTAITGNMMRALQAYYLTAAEITGCRDHLYGLIAVEFSCVIVDFKPTIHPTTGTFPGSGEDTYDLEVTLLKTA